MSPPEILHRIFSKLEEVTDVLYLAGKFEYSIVNTVSLQYASAEFHDKEFIISKADMICDNRMDLFALKDYNFGGKINYHMDYASGKSTPKDVLGKKINYRDAEKYGDIKYIWEINRHLYLPVLAQAYNITNNKKYISKIEYFLKEWFDQNPFMYGVNWESSLELGIRLINWTITWNIVNEQVSNSIRDMWLKSVYQHCWFVNRNLSAYSSANNHLIGEVAGLFIASIAMPQFKPSKKWNQKAYQILLRECNKQNYLDGVNKEQATSYQQFVLDFLIMAGLYGEKNGVHFGKDYWSIIEKMLEYVCSIMNVSGRVPQIGDEDDGYVIDSLTKDHNQYKSLLNTGSVFFKRDIFKRDNFDEDNKTKFLLSIYCEPLNYAFNEKKNYIPTEFSYGGYYVLGNKFGTKEEQKLIFDCGPLGYLSIAAHGHADSLSFDFSAGGHPIFIDPGTYAYHANKRWRNYFRGTLAHNTIRVDGLDQSVICGNFMWSKSAKSQLISSDPGKSVKATHYGYKRLKDGVQHIREINFNPSENRWDILDEIITNGPHEIEISYILHPDCACEFINKNEVLITFKAGKCILELDKSFGIEIVKGNEQTPDGWYSKSYDIKVPTSKILGKASINGSVKMLSCFKIEFE